MFINLKPAITHELNSANGLSLGTINRRHFLRAALKLPLVAVALSVPADVAPAQQTLDKPQLKRSEAKSVVTRYVDQMSWLAKQSGGTELSDAQRDKMINTILSDMEAQGVYNFVDP